MTLSRNEVQALVLKAARGGGLALGHAEDLATAVAYLDLTTLKTCPCSGDAPSALRLPMAIDAVLCGEGAQPVQAEDSLIAAYVSAAQAAGCDVIQSGQSIDQGPRGTPQTQKRQSLPQALLDHLHELASRTLVPETENSRLAGAGAGLTDND